jgi:hypothetical protein
MTIYWQARVNLQDLCVVLMEAIQLEVNLVCCLKMGMSQMEDMVEALAVVEEKQLVPQIKIVGQLRR